MSRSSTLADQQRELTFIINRLTIYSTLSDREILEARLKNLLNQNLSDEFFRMADELFAGLKETNPAIAEEIRGLFFNILWETKFELRTPSETTTMMTVGIFASSIFKVSPPNTVIDEKTADSIAEILKIFYLNPKAKIVVHHELLRSNQGPALNTETAQPLLKRMKACKGSLYKGDHFDYPDGPDDPIRAQENDRRYGLYLLHAVIAVTVPKGELTLCSPYTWSLEPSLGIVPEAGEFGAFIPHQLTSNKWNTALTIALRQNFKDYNLILTEPFPIIRGLDFLEQLMSPFRIFPFVMNAAYSAQCELSDISASLAVFCSRPDAAKIYASEIRIALARTSDRSHPFSGDCITLHEINEDINIISKNLENFLHLLGLTDIVFHEEVRYFEKEDSGGRIFVNADGISTNLCSPGEFGAPEIPANLIN